jgi:hypothetical protein
VENVRTGRLELPHVWEVERIVGLDYGATAVPGGRGCGSMLRADSWWCIYKAACVATGQASAGWPVSVSGGVLFVSGERAQPGTALCGDGWGRAGQQDVGGDWGACCGSTARGSGRLGDLIFCDVLQPFWSALFKALVMPASLDRHPRLWFRACCPRCLHRLNHLAKF